jgi:hypothetical protein
MSFSPDGTIYLIGGVLIDNSYEHTYSFENIATQLSYFQSKATHTVLEDYTFLRKNSSIKISKNFEDLWDVNYCLYRNESTGKWIFNFVTDKKYLNEGATELIIETDVLQTYLFDYTFKPSFIDREHQDRWDSNEDPILNYVAENITYGDEYIKTNEIKVVESAVKWFLVTAVDDLEWNPITGSDPVQTVPTPYYFYLIPYVSGEDLGVAIYDESGNALIDGGSLYLKLGDNADVISVAYIPYLPFTVTIDDDYAGGISGSDYQITASNDEIVPYQFENDAQSPYIFKVIGRDTYNRLSRSLQTIDRYEDYTLPSTFTTGINRNSDYESKLLTFPYFFYHLTDYQSQPLIIKNEYLDGEDFDIMVTQLLSHAPKTKYYIDEYKEETNGKYASVVNNTVNDLPLLSDAYQDYLLQNKASAQTGIATSLLSGAVALGVGFATGGVGWALAGGVATSAFSNISREMAKQKDIQNVPDSVRSQGNNIGFDMVDDNIHVRLVRYEITDEYKKIVGDFFAMYGYKCNELKTPDLDSRYYYNYIKAIGANITGNIDMFDLTRIKQVFNDGVTIWHYRGVGFSPLDYTYENIEMSLLD